MAHTNLTSGINITPTNSLVHLLGSNDTDDNNTYYDENDFSSMLANKAGLTIKNNAKQIHQEGNILNPLLTRHCFHDVLIYYRI